MSERALIQNNYISSLTPPVEGQHLFVVLQISLVFGALRFFQSMNFQLTRVFFSAERERERESTERGRETVDLTNHFHVQYLKCSIQLIVHRDRLFTTRLYSGLKVSNRPYPRQLGQKAKLGHPQCLALTTHPLHFVLHD